MISKSTSRNLTAGKNPTCFRKGKLLWVAEQPSINSGVISLYLVSEIIETFIVFMIKICVTLNEGHGQ